MANVTNFNRKLDLITEREVVYDFVSRLSIGKDWVDPQYDNTIFSAETNFKNLLRQMAKSLPTSVYNNLANLTTTYTEVSAGTKTVSATVKGTLLLAISERTGLDLTDCFDNAGGVTVNYDENGNEEYQYTYSMTLDVAYINNDIIRFYAISNPIT